MGNLTVWIMIIVFGRLASRMRGSGAARPILNAFESIVATVIGGAVVLLGGACVVLPLVLGGAPDKAFIFMISAIPGVLTLMAGWRIFNSSQRENKITEFKTISAENDERLESILERRKQELEAEARAGKVHLNPERETQKVKPKPQAERKPTQPHDDNRPNPPSGFGRRRTKDDDR
jgi:hypothetical protein